MRARVAGWLGLGLALLAPGCERAADEGGTTVVDSGVELDTSSRPGRVFVYLGAGGEVVRTARYESIPAERRGMVMVLEGDGRRGQARPGADGQPRIEVGKLDVRRAPDGGGDEARLGEEAAKEILAAGARTDEQIGDEELKKELEELEQEQAKETP
ncbi:MAG TPA: hypothetical protein PK668_25090 [Myxococcota bacterium]|nr:hypothetical protein [Myxococcota bacterium]HRY95302.1 hypothetical protein [Myxococcota bacterium]HSA20873.1 hypothetical protein [Myxococcota bacterium]